MNLDDAVAPLADQRIVSGAPATLEVFFTDQTGEPADVTTGTVKVGVQRADGTVVIAAGTNASHDTSTVGRYTISLDAGETLPLDLLTATWSINSTPNKQTLIDVAGGVIFTVAEARIRISSLTDALYPTPAVIAARHDLEIEFERICGAAFVPRYRRIRIDSPGSSCLQLPDPFIRTVREVTPPGGATFDSGQLGAITTSIDGELSQDDPFPMFSQGVVAYEYGLDRPPPSIKTVAFMRLRELLNFDSAAGDDRATTYHAPDGSSYDLNQPGEFTTGNPTIDATLAAYNYREKRGG